MLRNYLRVAIRSLNRHRLYSLINIAGLSIGLAAFFLIGLFVRQEQSFDRFHEKADQIFRVVQEQPNNVYLGSNHFAVTPRPLLEALVDEIPGVETSVQINNLEALLVAEGEGFFEEGFLASRDFFQVFSFPLDSGDLDEVLSRPDQIVLTRSLADRMFGMSDVVGRSIEYSYYSTKRTLTVTGVMADPPPTSHLKFGYLISFLTSSNWSDGGQWGNNSYITYGMADAPSVLGQLDARFEQMVREHMSGLDWIVSNPERLPRFYAQPLTEIHLHSRVNFDPAVLGDIRYVRLFTVIALMILIIASINYVNLATARSAVRAREVGVRKVAGAGRGQLIRQFLGESVSIAFISVLGAFAIALIALGPLGQLLERDIAASSLIQVGPIFFLLGTAFLVGVLAGIWPALFMSAMQPAVVLKGSIKGARRSLMRNALVIGQFCLGIILVVGVVVISQQMQFVAGFETGISRDQVVALRVRDSDLRQDASTFLQALDAIPGVQATTTSGHLPIRISSNSGMSDWEGAPEGASFHLWNTSVGLGFERMFELEFVAGSGFSEDRGTDLEEGLVLNQAAVSALGWTAAEAIGRDLEFQGREQRVLGVLEDFHFQTLKEEIAPLALWHSAERTSYVLARIDVSRTASVLDAVEDVWIQFADKYPLDLTFLDDSFRQQYSSERRLGSVLQMFTFLALIVAGLGLFGLASYTAQQRTREIGIRKTLGASTHSLVLMLVSEFGYLVLVAFLVGAPAAWLGARRWLATYAYHVDVGMATLLLVGVSAALLAFASVGVQAFRTSMLDPVASLRHEG